MLSRSAVSRRRPSAGRSLTAWGLAAVLAVSLAACGPDSLSSSAPSATPSAAPAAPARLTVSPANKTHEVALDAPVRIDVAGGRLGPVTVVPREGGGPAVTGAVATDGAAWTSAAPLKVDTDYVVTATATNADGKAAQLKTSFRTVEPERTVKASVLPQQGWTVGVGMPVVVDFTRSVKDKATAEKAMTVTSTPAVTGAWHWITDQQAQWRPERYWPADTEVKVTTALDGVRTAPGTYGTKTATTSFRVGSANVYKVDVDRHTLTATRNGKVQKVIPVTTGKSGYETRNGTKIVMTRESTRRMDAATTGTDPGDPEYYDIKVRYAMRLTWSGEFLHAAPWSVGSQGHANVSHGCTGMSTANAKWLFDHSKVGDVVEYTGSSRKLEWGNGYTAWNMSWPEWTS